MGRFLITTKGQGREGQGREGQGREGEGGDLEGRRHSLETRRRGVRDAIRSQWGLGHVALELIWAQSGHRNEDTILVIQVHEASRDEQKSGKNQKRPNGISDSMSA